MRRPNVVLRRFAMDAVQALQANMQTQHVFPTEIYPGFRKVNEYRKDHGGWYATGKGARSFTSRIDATLATKQSASVSATTYASSIWVLSVADRSTWYAATARLATTAAMCASGSPLWAKQADPL